MEPFKNVFLPQLVACLIDYLHIALPKDYGKRARIHGDMLHSDKFNHANQPSDQYGICGWGTLPLTTVVGQHGGADFELQI